jgi:hypothetical protein
MNSNEIHQIRSQNKRPGFACQQQNESKGLEDGSPLRLIEPRSGECRSAHAATSISQQTQHLKRAAQQARRLISH